MTRILSQVKYPVFCGVILTAASQNGSKVWRYVPGQEVTSSAFVVNDNEEYTVTGKQLLRYWYLVHGIL
mgnify:CR=1 FL=1